MQTPNEVEQWLEKKLDTNLLTDAEFMFGRGVNVKELLYEVYELGAKDARSDLRHLAEQIEVYKKMLTAKNEINITINKKGWFA